jgi:acyl dehydratase
MFGRLKPRQLKAYLGKEIGVSDWLVISQERIDAFAECSEDRQWIHVDRERAAKGPLGSTVAHAIMLLSLLPHFLQSSALFQAKFRMALNYGFDRVRFITPVKQGDRIRNRAVLKAIRKKGFRRILLTIENTIEIDGRKEPAAVAEFLAYVVI